MRETNRIQKGEYLVNVDFEEATETSIDFSDLQAKTNSEEFWDEASGKPMDYDKVICAREEEMKEVRRVDLYTKVPKH